MANTRADKPYRLTALGRLAASTRDAMGDTLGSFSGMALEPGSWRATKDGFAGVFVTLGDRGFNVPEKNEFRNYPTRVQRIAFELAGAKLSLTPIGTRYVRDENGALTTGLDPEWGSTEQFGMTLPSPEDGRAAGRLSLDAEGIAIKSDLSFFISDELGPNVYACGQDGRMTGVITPPDAFVPTCDGEVCFSARNAEPDRGRMPNDGFEGLSLSPDGKRLFVLLQNPLAQDRKGKREAQRYTRLLVYDVSGKRLPRKPVAHYVVELPLHGETLDGPMTEAAEANEVVALGGGRVLILTRESFGFGAKARHDQRSIVHKRVMIGSIDGASNLAGTRYERKAKSIMDGGKIDREIEAAAARDLHRYCGRR